MSSRGGKGSRDRADISPSPDDLRLVLLGRSGSGKSSAGNTLLGREEFRSVLSSAPVTQRCQAAHTESRGRRVSVVDTPDLFASGGADAGAHARACLALSDPGPHAFLLVLQLGRFTQGERKILEQVEQAFGPGARPHTVVLFTHGDDLEGVGLEDVLRGAQPELRQLLEHCGNRYHLFNNRDASDRRQVTLLLDTVDGVVQENRGGYYARGHGGRGTEEQQKDKNKSIKDRVLGFSKVSPRSRHHLTRRKQSYDISRKMEVQSGDIEDRGKIFSQKQSYDVSGKMEVQSGGIEDGSKVFSQKESYDISHKIEVQSGDIEDGSKVFSQKESYDISHKIEVQSGGIEDGSKVFSQKQSYDVSRKIEVSSGDIEHRSKIFSQKQSYDVSRKMEVQSGDIEDGSKVFSQKQSYDVSRKMEVQSGDIEHRSKVF
ncbi:GTPase IMAP family member 4-like [Lepisosteus oculatus]|uniref:GTPase IMAP family member 4-like n=1 Tax=Lepisosteus oculatus TaxID=7918 RepID=UPI0035F52DF0